jgi:hypothetical protein
VTSNKCLPCAVSGVHVDAVVGVGTWRAIDGDDHGKN